MKVMILAGGFATRLWPLTEHRAKPLLLLEGRTIIAHILDTIPREYEIFLLTNKAFEHDFRMELQKCGRTNFHIFCEDAFSDGEKLGALRALSLALKEFSIDDDILLCAGDNLLPELQVQDLKCSSEEARLAVRKVSTFDEARKFGVVEINEELMENAPLCKGGCPKGRGGFGGQEGDFVAQKNQEIIGFEEKPEHPKSKFVSTGFFSMGKDLFPILHACAARSPDALGGVFPDILKHGKTIRSIHVRGEWFDVGSFDSYLEAHQTLQTSGIQKGTNVLEKGNTFSGKVFLGDGCQIKRCRITDSIIYPNCVLEDCHISQSVIDEECHLMGLDLNRKLVRKGTKIREN